MSKPKRFDIADIGECCAIIHSLLLGDVTLTSKEPRNVAIASLLFASSMAAQFDIDPHMICAMSRSARKNKADSVKKSRRSADNAETKAALDALAKLDRLADEIIARTAGGDNDHA